MTPCAAQSALTTLQATDDKSLKMPARTHKPDRRSIFPPLRRSLVLATLSSATYRLVSTRHDVESCAADCEKNRAVRLLGLGELPTIP